MIFQDQLYFTVFDCSTDIRILVEEETVSRARWTTVIITSKSNIDVLEFDLGGGDSLSLSLSLSLLSPLSLSLSLSLSISFSLLVFSVWTVVNNFSHSLKYTVLSRNLDSWQLSKVESAGIYYYRMKLYLFLKTLNCRYSNIIVPTCRHQLANIPLTYLEQHCRFLNRSVSKMTFQLLRNGDELSTNVIRSKWIWLENGFSVRSDITSTEHSFDSSVKRLVCMSPNDTDSLCAMIRNTVGNSICQLFHIFAIHGISRSLFLFE